jgi:hypothetical protein
MFLINRMCLVAGGWYDLKICLPRGASCFSIPLSLKTAGQPREMHMLEGNRRIYRNSNARNNTNTAIPDVRRLLPSGRQYFDSHDLHCSNY